MPTHKPTELSRIKLNTNMSHCRGIDMSTLIPAHMHLNTNMSHSRGIDMSTLIHAPMYLNTNMSHSRGIDMSTLIHAHMHLNTNMSHSRGIDMSTLIHICWFNFDALAQGNAYKPTKEPINYRGPGGDRTHDLQTEATPPAASCPARTLHATEIAPKNATPMTCPWLHWTTDNLSGMHMVSISTPVCVNFELHTYT